MTSVAPFVIGIDAHQDTFTFVQLNARLEPHHSGTLPNTPEGYQRLLAGTHGESEFAIENAFAHARPLTLFLHAHKQRVFDVPTFPVARLRQRRHRAKSDLIDAEHVALMHARESEHPVPLRVHPDRLQLQSLSRSRAYLVRQRVATQAVLKALPEDAPIATVEALTSVITTLKEQIQNLERALRTALEPYGTLLELCGVGLVVASILIAEVQSMQRFRSEAAFASYAGIAPKEHSSGRSKRVRVNAGGNRRLNAAVEVITWTRLRLDERTRSYYARKRAQGMNARQAVRATKRVVCKDLYRVLVRVVT